MDIHPAAECFRLMHDDELSALAETIKENGLRDPITLGRVNGSKMTLLVDGRNRLRACEIAGIEPRFETIEFADDNAVRAFVRDRGERRDVTKSERAMAHAMLYPEPAKGGRGKTVQRLDSFSKQILSNARIVLDHSRALAEAVRDGTMPLDKALAKVKSDLEALQSDETKLSSLRAEAPDIAAQVEEERLNLSEAFAAFEQRKKNEAVAEENKRETIYRVAETTYRGILSWASPEFIADIEERLQDEEFVNSLLNRVRPNYSEFSNIIRGAKQMQTLLNKIAGKELV